MSQTDRSQLERQSSPEPLPGSDEFNASPTFATGGAVSTSWLQPTRPKRDPTRTTRRSERANRPVEECSNGCFFMTFSSSRKLETLRGAARQDELASSKARRVP